MSPIKSVSGVEAPDNMTSFSGVLSDNINTIDGVELPEASVALGSYVSTDLELHLNAYDSNDYTTTQWNDLSNNATHMTLVNSPTLPTGNDKFFEFDGVDQYMRATMPSTHTFYGTGPASGGTASALHDYWSIQATFEWPEDGSTGYIPADSFFLVCSRRNKSTSGSSTRGWQIGFGRQGARISYFYGYPAICFWPDSVDDSRFHYNNSRGRFEPKPNTKINVCLTIDLTQGATGTPRAFRAYLNTSDTTMALWESSGHNNSGDSTGFHDVSPTNETAPDDGDDSEGGLQYATNNNLEAGSEIMTVGVTPDVASYNGNFSATGSTHTMRIYDLLLYSRVITTSEMQQNLAASVDRFGSI